jgi:hypothetical protein
MTTQAKEPAPVAAREVANASLDLLLAEMWALATLMPGHPAPAHTDAEIEAEFDNIPV